MMNNKDYIISRDNYKKEDNSFWETVFSLTNGYLGVRNTVEFDEYSRPAAFCIDVYGFGLSVPKQILNLPNWLDNRITVGSEQIHLDHVKIHSFKQEMDMYSGCINTEYEIEHNDNRVTRIKREEFLAAGKNNVYLEKISITPLNYSDKICIDCMLTDVGNAYHGGYQGEFVRSYHWNCIEEKHDMNRLYAKYTAIDSDLNIRIASNIELENMPQSAFGEVHGFKTFGNRYEYCAKENESAAVVRITNILIGNKEKDEDNTSSEEFEALLTANRKAWKEKWEKYHLEIEGNDKAKQGLVYSLFQMLQYSDSWENVLNVPARGLTSYYHSGHFFFNTDLYLVPYYCWFKPEMAKKLIMYRVNSLQQARENAKELGYKGIFWSEESGPNGEPAGPTVLNDYKNGVRFEEYTGRQVKHLACDAVYSIHYYLEHVNDESFMNQEVCSLIAEAARFYCDYLQLCDSGHYEMHGIMGIDEYHMLIDNSFYTMQMIEWLLKYAIEVYEKNGELMHKSGVDNNEVETWKKVLANLKPPTVQDDVFEQFDGFFGLQPIKIEQWADNGLPYIDEELRKEIFHLESFDTQLVKQCDVIMLLSMFADKYSKKQLDSNYRYYEPRTLHESSLSATHAGMIAYLIDNEKDGDKYLKISSRFNLDFEPRDNYNNGVHVAANAGAWMILMQGMLGMYVKDDTLFFDPHGSEMIKRIRFRFFFRGNELEVTLDSKEPEVKVISFKEDAVNVKIRDEIIRFEKK